MRAGSWRTIRLVIDDSGAAGTARYDLKRQLLSLYEDTRASLQDGGFDFALLLVDETESPSERTAAVADWCRGFLFSLMQAGV